MIVPPTTRFPDTPGEQKTLFFRDPNGYALEFKSFADDRFYLNPLKVDLRVIRRVTAPLGPHAVSTLGLGGIEGIVRALDRFLEGLEKRNRVIPTLMVMAGTPGASMAATSRLTRWAKPSIERGSDEGDSIMNSSPPSGPPRPDPGPRHEALLPTP